MRTVRRQRRYVGKHVLLLLRPLFRYSYGRDAYVLRVVGGTVGPVLRIDRRHDQRPFQGGERRARVA